MDKFLIYNIYIMDSNTTLILVMVIVNVATNIFTAALNSFQVFFKLVRKSECCGSKIEFKSEQKDKDDTPVKIDNNKMMDVIIHRLSKNGDVEK